MDANIQKALNDKLYEKRKGGALDSLERLLTNRLEALVRDALAAGDHDRIQKIVHQLCHDYAYAIHAPHARNGGLIGLAAASIALGGEVARYLEEIVPPVLACFSDQDARVRYYACESMYNIAKVAKGEILLYFNEVFDALCKLAADSEMSVKNGAELLDRLVKDIVSESASSYVSVLYHPDDVLEDTDSVLGEGETTAPSINIPTAFSLSRFIPLLQERINVINPFTRTFLVNWLTLLDSIPELELVSYLPSFLGGLFKFLGDFNQDVHTTTQTALDRFLQEVKKIARIKRGIAESKKSHGEYGGKVSGSSVKSGRSASSSPSMRADNESTRAADEDQDDSSRSSVTDTSTINDEKSGYTDGDWIPGQDVQVNHAKILEILVAFLNSDSPEEEIQLTALRWIDSLFEICPEDILLFVPRLLSQVLPAMANDVDQVRQAANRVNQSLMDYIVQLPDEGKADGPRVAQLQLSTAAGNSVQDLGDRRNSNLSTSLKKSSTREAPAESKSRAETRTPTPPPADPSPSPQQRVDLDYDAAVNALTLQFLNEHEATRVAALSWLIMLHRKAPRKILAINDGTFPALLKTLSDPSESVVTRDLLLLSQISKNSDDSYFTSFMVSLLSLFATDRRLLETRGNLIIRQLCLSLSAERIYRTLADCLEKDEDVEFASIMVQNLNNNLITAPELADLRKRLRNPETKDGQNFFTALFRAWCHNAVASFSLCLLAQAYEQAYHLLQIFGELEMTVNMLIQIDKLVQLLESPVFTYLRLQLLEPEKYPQLYKCLYGLLMLLPQSSAFAALKNRLNSVSAIGYLHIAPRTVPTPTSATGFESRNRLKSREENSIKWQELLDKFKQTQEKARRAQRIATFGADSVTESVSNGGTISPTQEKKPAPRSVQRPNSAASVGRPAPAPAPAQGHQKSKSSLSQLGRFAGSVGARKARK